ncbi:MAG: DUF1292 domain-containing protein [Clostridia bacterium]|nr:DUF1292 domain-containing protein [Clostridia bacterium]
MAEFDKNNNEEIEDLGDIIYTLTDEDTGEEIDFQLIARATLDDVLYFALVPADDEECDEYVILRVSEDGEDVLLESIDDDDEFEKVEEYFNDLLFGDVDYDEE